MTDTTALCDIGFIGLGVMGKNLTLNLADNGYKIACFDLDHSKVDAIVEQDKKERGDQPPRVFPCTSFTELLSMVKVPHLIILSVPAGDPVEEILKYAKHKLKMSRLYPRESRLYATEIIQGAPRIKSVLTGELRDVVENLALLINHWADSGSIRAVDPYHLIFSIWAITQHYADFEVQVKAILGERDHFEDAEQYLEDMLRRMLAV